MTLTAIISPFLSINLKLRFHDPLLSFLPFSSLQSSRSPPPRLLHFSSPITPISASTHSSLQVPNTAISVNHPGSTTGWSEFARNVSGEWDGYGAEFSIDGKPIELPESVVPEAFREWEVKVFDWQTQCPTLALPEEPNPSVSYKLIKLLPTVGCEADAATCYTMNERNIGGTNNKVSSFAYEPSGCYVAVWPVEDTTATCIRSLELEHCLMDPQNRESRVRIVQSVRVENGSKMVLQKIEVFCEQWYGPFRNGEQLGGCAVRDSAFASTDAIRGSEVFGVWQQGPTAKATFLSSQSSIFQELIDEGPDGGKSITREKGDDIILLPKQLWCTLKEREDGETCGEVGWVLDYGRAITSRCIFSSNSKLKEIAIVHEAAEVVSQGD